MRTSPRRFKKYIAEAATGISDPVYQIPNSPTKKLTEEEEEIQDTVAPQQICGFEEEEEQTNVVDGEEKKERDKMKKCWRMTSQRFWHTAHQYGNTPTPFSNAL